MNKDTKVWFNFVVYNPRTQEIGQPFLVNDLWLLDVGLPNGFRILTDEWQQVGKL